MKCMVTRVKKNGRFIVLLSLVIFSLSMTNAYAYPAPQFRNAMVFASNAADGSISTTFFAIISGPSPVDVTSFTATGPSGTYNLTSSRSFQQYGLYYAHGENAVLNSGSYTLTITDSIGRTASVVREFVYNDSIPTPTSLLPVNETYTGTTTPTLSFSPVTGNYSYQVQIQDYDQKAIWYSSPMMTVPSLTVPDNMLQANTAYLWFARIWDTALQNLGQSMGVFYTGTKGAPEINMRGVLSFPWDEGIMNYPYARGIAVAPWDIDYFRSTGPDDAVYDLNRRYFRFWLPAFNANITVFDPPVSMPDGTYTFDIKDNLGRTASQTRIYTYNLVPDFIEDARIPADNAYLDSAWTESALEPVSAHFKFGLLVPTWYFSGLSGLGGISYVAYSF